MQKQKEGKDLLISKGEFGSSDAAERCNRYNGTLRAFVFFSMQLGFK